MHVAHQLQQIGLGLDQQRLVAPLEQVADAPLAGVHKAGGAERQVLYRPRQGRLAGLDHQVHVVGHQAIAVDAVAEARNALGEQVEEPPPVGHGEEDVLPAVAPQHHVIDAARNMQARLACHAGRLTRARQQRNNACLTPFRHYDPVISERTKQLCPCIGGG